MATSDGLLETLERRSATVFLVAGGLLTVFAVNTGLRTFVGQSSPLVQNLVAPVGFLSESSDCSDCTPRLPTEPPRRRVRLAFWQELRRRTG